jgi:hypothetical protein
MTSYPFCQAELLKLVWINNDIVLACCSLLESIHASHLVVVSVQKLSYQKR